MVKLGLSLITIALLVSCSSKEEHLLIQAYKEKQNQYKYLQKTEKVQFKEHNITKTVVTATYMNAPKTSIEDEPNEVFLVGIYSEDTDMSSINSQDFSIKLKEVKSRKALNIEKKLEHEACRKEKIEDITLKTDTSNTTCKKQKKHVVYLDPIDIKPVPNDSPLLKDISFVSSWNRFYLVSYKYIAGNRLLLKIKTKKSEEYITKEIVSKKIMDVKNKKITFYSTQRLFFSKVAKYAL